MRVPGVGINTGGDIVFSGCELDVQAGEIALNGSRYANYHVAVMDENGGRVIREADVNDDKGYVLDVETGTYLLTVSDKAGNKTVYAQKITVVPSTREGGAYVNILTDY